MPVSVVVVAGLSAFAGGLLQANMGFGSALILVNVLPLFFPFNKTVALMQGAMVFLNIFYFIRYYRKIRWDVVTPALIPGALLGLVFTIWSVRQDSALLTLFLGVLFLALSVYELAFSRRVHVKPSKLSGFLMGGFSGITNAFAGIAGPPVALYLVPSIDDNLEYFATSQCFFLLCSVPCIVARIVSGIYEVSDLPVLAVLLAGLLLGAFVGLKILKKIETDVLKKLIYAFVGVNGIYIIVKHLVSG